MVNLTNTKNTKDKEGKTEQKLWKRVSFQLLLEHRQGLRFT